jgi:hypothetical protein
MISAPAKLAMVWFGEVERATATTIGALAVPIGAVVAFLLPLLIVTDPGVKGDWSPEQE